MSSEAKHRFTISISQDAYNYLEEMGGERGRGKYVEQLVLREKRNINNIGSVVSRLDQLHGDVEQIESFMMLHLKIYLKALSKTLSAEDIAALEAEFGNI